MTLIYAQSTLWIALQNLRVTLWNSGYGMSVYLVVAKFKVFNSLQFIIGIIGRIVSGLFTTYIVRLVDKLTQK